MKHQISALYSIGLDRSPGLQNAVLKWLEILEAENLEILAGEMLPGVMGPAFLEKNRLIRDKMVKAMVKRNRQESLLGHLRALKTYPPLSSYLKKLNHKRVWVGLGEKESAKRLADFCQAPFMVFPGGHSFPMEYPDLCFGWLHTEGFSRE